MKYVTGKSDKLRVIELPDDARPITQADELVLEQHRQQAIAKQREREALAAQAEQKLAKETRIYELKRQLSKTDYQALKYAEGEMSAEEFAVTKELRRAWRTEINALEAELEA